MRTRGGLRSEELALRREGWLAGGESVTESVKVERVPSSWDSGMVPHAAAANVGWPRAEPPGWPGVVPEWGRLFSRKRPANLRLPRRLLLTKDYPGRTQEENSHSKTHYSGLLVAKATFQMLAARQISRTSTT